MAPKKKPKLKVTFTDDSGPAARRPEPGATAAPDPLNTTAFRDLAAERRAEAVKPLAEVKASLRPLVARAEAAIAELERLAAEHGPRVRALLDGTDFRLLCAYLPAHEVHRYERTLDDAVTLAANAPGTVREIKKRIAGLVAGDLNSNAVNTARLELGWTLDYPRAYRAHVEDIRAMTRNFEERLARKRQRGEGPGERIIDAVHPEPQPQPLVETD